MNFRLASSTEAVEKRVFPPCVNYREALLHQEAPGMPWFGRGKKPRVCRGLAAGSLTSGTGEEEEWNCLRTLLCVKRDYIPEFLQPISDIFLNREHF